jgi:hypothetical protein
MSWIDTLNDNVFLRALFPQSDPSLNATRLHELRLHQDGPAILLRFDLEDYPEQPPAKWQSGNGNTVQVCLEGSGVRDVRIVGWTLSNVGCLTIKKGTLVSLEFDAGACNVIAAVEHLRVAAVTSYQDDARDGSGKAGPASQRR